jgi:YD repeat-containing protein
MSGLVVPIPDRVDAETDENGNITGVYELYEDENTIEEVFKEADEDGTLVVKWVLRTQFDEEKNTIEERFTHDGILSSIKMFIYNDGVFSRNGDSVSEIEYRNAENELEHREEFTYDQLGRLVLVEHWDVFSGEETKSWHTIYVYEGEQSEPIEEWEVCDQVGYVNPGFGDSTMWITEKTYDENGNLIEKSATYDGDTYYDIFFYTYDEQGRLLSEEYHQEGTFTWEKKYIYEGEALRSIELLDNEENLLKKKTFG